MLVEDKPMHKPPTVVLEDRSALDNEEERPEELEEELEEELVRGGSFSTR